MKVITLILILVIAVAATSPRRSVQGQYPDSLDESIIHPDDVPSMDILQGKSLSEWIVRYRQHEHSLRVPNSDEQRFRNMFPPTLAGYSRLIERMESLDGRGAQIELLQHLRSFFIQDFQPAVFDALEKERSPQVWQDFASASIINRNSYFLDQILRRMVWDPQRWSQHELTRMILELSQVYRGQFHRKADGIAWRDLKRAASSRGEDIENMYNQLTRSARSVHLNLDLMR